MLYICYQKDVFSFSFSLLLYDMENHILLLFRVLLFFISFMNIFTTRTESAFRNVCRECFRYSVLVFGHAVLVFGHRVRMFGHHVRVFGHPALVFGHPEIVKVIHLSGRIDTH